VIAAYAFREELDNALLDISAANSQANSALGAVQPFLSIFNNLSGFRYDGSEQVIVDLPGRSGWAVENAVGLQATWNIFDGGAARAQYRQAKQKAQENALRFADTRDRLRFEVEESFYQLRQANRNIQTTSRQVLSSREALRLARLRFQAGVSTQREVVDNQRDVTQAELAYAQALAEYNDGLSAVGLAGQQACRRFHGNDSCAARAPPACLPGCPGRQGDVLTVQSF
jgi:OMF family outer membrane factor